MTNIIRFASALGLAAVLGGLVSIVPAQAQDYHVRRDIADVRRDERKLDDLYNRRQREVDRRDWRDVRRIDREIAELRRHINEDRRDIRGDVRRDDNYYRDYNRDRHTGDNYNRYRDNGNSNRYRDNGNYNRNRDNGSFDRYRNGEDYNGRDH